MNYMMVCFGSVSSSRVLLQRGSIVQRRRLHYMRSDRQCEQLLSGHDLFKREFLVSPAKIQCAIDGLLRSRAAVMPCGELRQNDIVWLEGARCGRINWFYDYRGEMYVDVNMMAHVENDPSKYIARDCGCFGLDL